MHNVQVLGHRRRLGRVLSEMHCELRGGVETPGRAALAVGLGTAIGCLPLYGAHLILCLAAARAFRISPVKTYLAAHVNNPIGGMGLNGGIHDAMNLTEKLAPVWKGDASIEELARYDVQRRTTAIRFVQAQTIQNKKRLEENDPDVRQANLNELRDTASDPVRAKEFLMGTAMLTSVRDAAELG